MWLATQIGFFSVVIDSKREGRMLVRARCKADIYNLFDAHRDLKSMEPPTSDERRDYRWRMSISREDWVTLAGRLAGAIDYPNFKNAVLQREDQHHKHYYYVEMWGVLRRLQLDEDPPLPTPKTQTAKGQ